MDRLSSDRSGGFTKKQCRALTLSILCLESEPGTRVTAESFAARGVCALDRELMSFKVPVTYKPPSGKTLKKYICALLPKELKKAKWTSLVRTLTVNDVRTHIALIPVILLGTGYKP